MNDDPRLQQLTGIVGRFILFGEGDPEGVVTAEAPALWFRLDSSAGAAVYVKETGSGNTGWGVL